jgi:hypothetical protein
MSKSNKEYPGKTRAIYRKRRKWTAEKPVDNTKDQIIDRFIESVSVKGTNDDKDQKTNFDIRWKMGSGPTEFVIRLTAGGWTAQEGDKIYNTMGTLSINPQDFSNMLIGTCSIKRNEINHSKKYAFCKSDTNTFKIYPIKDGE